jgi:hypothetical protein
LDCAERTLAADTQEFAGAYMAVSNIQYVANKDAACLRDQTLALLAAVLCRSPHASQRQVYFLHRKAAMALATTMTATSPEGNAGRARSLLTAALTGAPVSARNAVCEAMGSLPWSTQRAPAPSALPGRLPSVSWPQVVSAAGYPHDGSSRWRGRSLVMAVPGKPALVVKMTANPRQAPLLCREADWMTALGRCAGDFCERFEVPRPLRFDGSPVFRLSAPPSAGPADPSQAHAIAFTVDPDYYRYPNSHSPPERLTDAQAEEVISRNAAILGRMARMGWLHTALIPLFHNRLQQGRRHDAGRYQWQRGGRLDRWLDSCRYPNIGVSGVRDFEHIAPLTAGDRSGYDIIGMQFFSLALIAGSHFRAKSPQRRGLDSKGRPVDTRDLFDTGRLASMLSAIFSRFYLAFVERPCPPGRCRDIPRLAERMTAEMGVDRYMTEILRVADQERMTDAQFRRLLAAGGVPEHEAARMIRGGQEITMTTGPHLGGFNQRISLPELSRFAGSAAAQCIADRYWKEKTGR